MKKIIFSLCGLLLSLDLMADTKIICSYEGSEDGKIENECQLNQHNSDKYCRMNIQSANDLFTVHVVGKKEFIDREDGSDDACYFELVLSDNQFFKSGDVITITAFRNVNPTQSASFFFKFSSGATMTDGNVWNNFGLLEDINVGGNPSMAKPLDMVTPSIGEIFYIDPSTYEFVVPAEAEGSSSMKITRDKSDAVLYLVSINVARDEATGIKSVTAAKNDGIVRNLQGIQVGKNYRGVVIKDGRKVVQ